MCFMVLVKLLSETNCDNTVNKTTSKHCKCHLQQGYEEKEDIRIFLKLFVEELGNEWYEAVLCCAKNQKCKTILSNK